MLKRLKICVATEQYMVLYRYLKILDTNCIEVSTVFDTCRFRVLYHIVAQRLNLKIDGQAESSTLLFVIRGLGCGRGGILGQ